MKVFSKIFGDANEKYIKQIQPLVDEINRLEPKFEDFSDEEIHQKSQELKEKAKREEPLDDLLVEAFALMREASKRTLKQRHFDVQIMGGIIFHQGKIAEMKTGEGKTLSSTLAIYLNALKGGGVHVITVNDYLAKRDVVWMGQIYHFLGLSTGCIVHDTAYIYDPNVQNELDEKRDTLGGFKVEESFLRPCSRKEAYAADITYGTNNEFGFDYLRDNMVYDLKDKVQRSFDFAIIDEVDSILIDEARTPLIISAPDAEAAKMYGQFASIISQLKAENDYEIEEKSKSVTLTEKGIEKIEKILGLENIYEEKGFKYLHYLEQSLRAKVIFKKDRHYVVKDNQVIIVDDFTGRLLPGRRYSGGLHQAIEAKEGVNVQPESKTLASITFQNYFRLYNKLAGMTGTAATSAEEFHKVYNLEVVIVPTNKPMIRKDFSDKIFKNEQGKFMAVKEEIKKRNQTGQPVLVGTTSIEKNEYLGKLLEREGVSHQILNAKHHQKEGEIIAQAGRLNAVTIATNMAGRGVDIILGGNPPNKEESQKVIQLGGLCVIGTERHEARRIDNQLRGRSGRQGDPGSSQFFVSLEDDLLRIFGGERIQKLMETLKIPEDQPIQASLVSGVIESAQGKIEGMNFDLRKHLLDYDDVLNKHREVVYKKRNEILDKFQNSELKAHILEIIKKQGKTEEDYLKKEKEIGEDNMRKVEKIIVLRTIDLMWIDHLESMEYLRDAVRLRAYGQQDPLVEYKNEGHKMFRRFLDSVENNIAETIFKVSLVKPEQMPNRNLEFSSPSSSAPQPRKKPAFNKVGRNDPCPCGSGKKYKKCCGK